MSTKSSSKHSSNDYYLCPPSTVGRDLDFGALKQPLVTPGYSKTPPSTQEKSMREGLGDYLENIPGDLNSPGPADWSLQHLIFNPPRADNELSYFSGTQFMGFILKEGEPIPELYKMEPSNTGVERLKKKHKSKKHKINQQDSLNHLLDKIPPDVPIPTLPAEPNQDSNYGSATDIRKRDKKHKKAKKKLKEERRKKKTKQKEDDDRSGSPPYSMKYHYTS